jgi:hypothetical protein
MAKMSPTHHAYHVREYQSGKEKKSFWTKIGSAWPHGDGEGFNIRLNLLPPDGNIVIRTVQEKKPEAGGEEAEFVDADGVVT